MDLHLPPSASICLHCGSCPAILACTTTLSLMPGHEPCSPLPAGLRSSCSVIPNQSREGTWRFQAACSFSVDKDLTRPADAMALYGTEWCTAVCLTEKHIIRKCFRDGNWLSHTLAVHEKGDLRRSLVSECSRTHNLTMNEGIGRFVGGKSVWNFFVLGVCNLSSHQEVDLHGSLMQETILRIDQRQRYGGWCWKVSV